MYESSRILVFQIVLSLSKYWCKFGRILFVECGSLGVIGTARIDGWGGSGIRGRGGGLVLMSLEEVLDSSSEPVLDSELHCEQDSEHSESVKAYLIL